MELREVFEPVLNFIKNFQKKDGGAAQDIPFGSSGPTGTES